MNLAELKKFTTEHPAAAAQAIHVQITGRTPGTTTKAHKPFIDLEIADASASDKIRIWQDTPAYKLLEDFPQMGKGTAIEIVGRWEINDFGLGVKEARIKSLTPAEMNALFTGGAAFTKLNGECWEVIMAVIRPMSESAHPWQPLGLVCLRLLETVEKPFRRAAAAHGVHHARRGGLLEHTASMMRAAVALAPCYPEVSPEIVCAGVLLHDIGKILETDYQAEGFALAPDIQGALIGHISAGILLLHKFWDIVHGDDRGANDLLLNHVTHCILAHHGQKEWGSPMEPVTPEAVLLHHIDMIDAGIEKLRNAYRAGTPSCSGAVRAVYPMKGDVALPFNASADCARMCIRAVLLTIPPPPANEPQQAVNYGGILMIGESRETTFCKALHAAGITTEIAGGLESISLAALDTARRRWGELQVIWPDLPSLPRRDESDFEKVTFGTCTGSAVNPDKFWPAVIGHLARRRISRKWLSLAEVVIKPDGSLEEVTDEPLVTKITVLFVAVHPVVDEYQREMRSAGGSDEIATSDLQREMSREHYWIKPPATGRRVHRFQFGDDWQVCWAISLWNFPFADDIKDALA